MEEKIETLLLLLLPIIAAFNYVVAHRIIQEATASKYTPFYEQFYFVVVSTAIFHLFWGFMIVVICFGAFRNVRFWRILTSFIAIQTILLYGLAVWMSLFLSQAVYNRDSGYKSYNTDYFVTWSGVSVACLWFDFIVFLLILFRHIYTYDEFVPIDIEDPSRMERK